MNIGRLLTDLGVGDSGHSVGRTHRGTCVIPSFLKSSMKCSMISFPLAIFSPYCFIANFSMLCSNPKKNLISTLAVCSKQVHSEFSGCTWNYLNLLYKYVHLRITIRTNYKIHYTSISCWKMYTHTKDGKYQ